MMPRAWPTTKKTPAHWWQTLNMLVLGLVPVEAKSKASKGETEKGMVN
jgi:hypothetical protein